MALGSTAGALGKAGQLVLVSDGSPHLLVAEADGRAERDEDLGTQYLSYPFLGWT